MINNIAAKPQTQVYQNSKSQKIYPAFGMMRLCTLEKEIGRPALNDLHKSIKDGVIVGNIGKALKEINEVTHGLKLEQQSRNWAKSAFNMILEQFGYKRTVQVVQNGTLELSKKPPKSIWLGINKREPREISRDYPSIRGQYQGSTVSEITRYQNIETATIDGEGGSLYRKLLEDPNFNAAKAEKEFKESGESFRHKDNLEEFVLNADEVKYLHEWKNRSYMPDIDVDYKPQLIEKKADPEHRELFESLLKPQKLIHEVKSTILKGINIEHELEQINEAKKTAELAGAVKSESVKEAVQSIFA